MKFMQHNPVKAAKLYNKQRLEFIEPLEKEDPDKGAYRISVHDMELDHMMMTILLDHVPVDPMPTAKKLVPTFLKHRTKGARFAYIHDLVLGDDQPNDLYATLLASIDHQIANRRVTLMFMYADDASIEHALEEAGFSVLLPRDGDVPPLYHRSQK